MAFAVILSKKQDECELFGGVTLQPPGSAAATSGAFDTLDILIQNNIHCDTQDYYVSRLTLFMISLL